MWLLVGLGCGSVAGGPCDRRPLSDAMTAGGSIDERMRSAFAAAAIAETCPRLDPEMIAALDQLQSAPPDYRRMVDAKLVADHPQWWIAACPEGFGVLAEAMSARRSDFGPMVHQRCALDSLGFSAADVGGDGFPLTAVMVRKALRDAGAPDIETTQLTRMLAR